MDNGELFLFFGAGVFFWILLFIFSVWKPHRLFNSVFLTLALFFTALTVLSVFTQDIAVAFVIVAFAVIIVLLLIPFILIYNGVVMMKREGKSLANILSLLLGIGIEIGELALFIDVIYAYGMDVLFFKKLSMPLLFVGMSVFYFSFLILLFVLYMIFFQFVPHLYNFEYIIIHGCGLLGGDRVSKLLSNRIDKAIKVYKRGKKKAMIIPSGGQGGNETISEAEAIAGYLKEKGIPEEHILLEDKSTTTEENLVNSYELIKERGGSKRIALVSSNYHIYRCVLLARQLGIPCVGIGARVALYYWPSAVIREFVAVYSQKKRLIFIILGYLLFISPFIYMAFFS